MSNLGIFLICVTVCGIVIIGATCFETYLDFRLKLAQVKLVDKLKE